MPLDNCAPKNQIRFYISPLKVYNQERNNGNNPHQLRNNNNNINNYNNKRDQRHVSDITQQQHYQDSERNWMTDNAGGVNLKHLNNNLNNLAICCNSWKHVGLINVKKAAGYVTKINYTD